MSITDILAMAGIPSAIMSLGIWALKKQIDKKEKQQEERDQAREESEVLMIESISANTDLSIAIACAIKNGKCNGEMKEAFDRVKKVKTKHDNFLARQATKNLY